MCRGRRVEDGDGASGRGRRGRVQRFMDVVKEGRCDRRRWRHERLSGLLKEGVMCVFVC